MRLTEISHSYAADGDRPYLRTGEILMLTVGFLANTASFFYTTRRGKFLEWERILDRVHLRGDEMVLDMGAAEARC